MAKNDKTSLEDKLHELEKIIVELESDELSLEGSIDKFEDGVKLYKVCKDKLGVVEKRIKVLTAELKEEEYV